MSGLGATVLKTLKGDFLIDQGAVKNWRLIFLILTMSIVMITCSHQTDEKIMRIAKLNKKVRSLKAEYIDSATKVTRLKMESTVKEKVVHQDLYPSNQPPIKIKVTKE